MVSKFRNKLFHFGYAYILKPYFFRKDPEVVHDRMIRFGAKFGKNPFGKGFLRMMFDYSNPMLEQSVVGLAFKNPVGLAAGFDKNAELTDVLSSVGFGFMEVGSITGDPCKGNPKPRLWRLKKSKSLVVYYGLKNDGCEVIANRLKTKQFTLPVGISVAMTNCEDNMVIENAVKDYAKAFKEMTPIAQYVTVNISCPNTQGGQPFVEPYRLDYLFDILDEIPCDKPIFVKLSPDAPKIKIDEILEVLKKHRVQGIICTNLTKNRSNPRIKDTNIPAHGGMSGKVVQEMSDELLKYIYRREKERFVLVGCGGIFTAEDAYKKIRLGASLVQLATGMIYEGPQLIGEINRRLVELLKRDGFKHINEAIGVDNR